MTRPLTLPAVLHAALACPLAAAQRAPQDTTALRRHVDSLFAEWGAPGSPGGAVVLTHHGSVILTRTYGLADLERRVTERLRVTLRGEEMWTTRVQLRADAPPADDFIGLYYSGELDAAREIARGADGLAVRTPDSERPLHRADTDVVVGAIGILAFRRDTDGRVVGFELGEPEDLNQRLIRFVRCGTDAAGERGR